MIGLHRKVEAVSGKWPEILVLLIYAAAHLGMALVHEPFFDEAEAWQIARSASLKTLLLETTHYEGHPPLWHLILMPFAKAGAPYELSLTLVSLLFMGTAMFLILWYAPFPRLVRLLLPFTYFFFYQYGVISRVYCVMTLAFVLLAMAYRRRNERPGRYVAVLILMCVTLAYGIVIAGGLALVWLWEIWGDRVTGLEKPGSRNRKGGRSVWKTVSGFAADRRIWWLAVLLVAALCVIWQIMPREDTFATASAASETIENSFAVRLLYTFLVLPADAMLTDIYSDHIILPQAYLMPSALVSGALIGMMIWGVMLYYGRKKGTVLLLVLPYSLFAVFSAAMYFSLHHIGIGLLYFGFWCWASVESVEDAEGTTEVCPPGEDTECTRQDMSVDMADAVQCAAVLLGTLAMGISLYWTGAACVLDVCKNYAPGRREAAFIREHHLERYRMMSSWMITYDEEGNVSLADINQCNLAVNLAPYFEHNLFFNFNDGRDDRNYITHIRLSEEETQERYESWGEAEPPQVLWMLPDLSAVYGGKVSMRDYALVYQEDGWQVWKAGANYYECDIHVRRDLLEETGLRPLQAGE
ncbi:MAG: hypothetical protein K2N00_02090 [Lachnospiraceae bacterium]|nr:hypothetical protein [Lachnospiraceae bacterium]